MQPSISYNVQRVVTEVKNKNLVKISVIKILKKNKILRFLLLIAACGVVSSSLIPPQILKLIVDRNLVPRSGDGLRSLAIGYMSIILLIGFFDFVKEALLTVLGQKVTKEIRFGMFEKLERMNASFFSSNGTGIIVSRFTNDVDAINTMFTSGIVGMAIDCLKVIGIIASIWFFSGKLGIITLILLPAIYFVTRLFQKSMLKSQMKNRVQLCKN